MCQRLTWTSRYRAQADDRVALDAHLFPHGRVVLVRVSDEVGRIDDERCLAEAEQQAAGVCR